MAVELHECDCFASECSDWPLTLILEGIAHPSLSLVIVVMLLDLIESIKFANRSRKRPLAPYDVTQSVRTLLRALVLYYACRALDFVRQEAHIFRYQGSTGFIWCFVCLLMIRFLRKGAEAFVEIWILVGLWESLLLLFATRKQGDHYYRVVTSNFTAGFVCIVAAVLSCCTLATYSCMPCGDPTLSLIELDRSKYDLTIAVGRFLNAIDTAQYLLLMLTAGVIIVGGLVSAFFFGGLFKINADSIERNQGAQRRMLIAVLVAVVLTEVHRLRHHAADASSRFCSEWLLYEPPQWMCFFDSASNSRHKYFDAALYFGEQISVAIAAVLSRNYLRSLPP